jgi:FixJ family two-component response regulator
MAFTAYSGGEAIEKFRKADPKPGVVIIDYRLPDMSGLEVMNGILSIDPHTKIVFISGDGSIRQESLDAGTTTFMKKPTPIKEITETINSLMHG